MDVVRRFALFVFPVAGLLAWVDVSRADLQAQAGIADSDAASNVETAAAESGTAEASSEELKTGDDSPEGVVREASFLQPPAQPPLVPGPGQGPQLTPRLPGGAERLSSQVFGSRRIGRSLLSRTRQRRTRGPATDVVFGREGRFRITTDGGSLLGKSRSASGVATQARTPIVSDPRIRGTRTGGLLASGSYWAPARQDLDTLLSKIDSRIIDNMIVVKGPFAVRYGPGYQFIDFQLLKTPRYEDGFEVHGSSSLEYQTNGEQWYGRQVIEGGAEDYGFRIGYGHRTGSDYRTGDGSRLPTSYKSRDLDLALGFDLDDESQIEFRYLRQDQTDVEFPGLVFDIDDLVTDAYEVEYETTDTDWFDLLTADAWYNRTRFNGDTSRSGKNRQIPSIRDNFNIGPDQFLTTNVNGTSAGYRLAGSLGDADEQLVTLGTDLIYLQQELNDVVPAHDDFTPFPPPFGTTLSIPSRNFPIPKSDSLDVGLFLEHDMAVDSQLSISSGARVDFIGTDARDVTPGLQDGFDFSMFPTIGQNPVTLSELKQAGLEQHFVTAAAFTSAEYQIDPNWSATTGVGFAMRPPTMTELYSAGPFIGSLQSGLTFLEGDPELDPEKVIQIDVGASGDFEGASLRFNGFFSWIHDKIIYDHTSNHIGPFVPGETFQQVALGNTDLAILAGGEMSGEFDLNRYLTAFGSMSYVEGRDLSRETPTRVGEMIRNDLTLPTGQRSGTGGDHEALQGIPPLETRLGIRIDDGQDSPGSGVELEVRIVDNQDRVATSLFEASTPGFTVWNLRSFWRASDQLTFYAGVENFTDKFYREHLDFRSGRGVFRPGSNFYFSGELTY